MKTKKADLVAKILITAVVVVLTGLLIAWMAGVFKDKKKDLDSGTGKIDDTISSMADFDLLAYDGNTISGDTLSDLITDFKTKDVAVSIWVVTLDGTNAYYNYAFTPASNTLGAANATTPPPSKATAGYITPSGSFLGAVVKNANAEIVSLKFTQKK